MAAADVVTRGLRTLTDQLIAKLAQEIHQIISCTRDCSLLLFLEKKTERIDSSNL
jgi:hypothetical protein